jgi:hypothetical protein
MSRLQKWDAILGGKVGLFDVVLNLHGMYCGSGEEFSYEEEAKMRLALQQRLENWSPSTYCSEKFDDIVKSLVVCVLNEREDG